MFIFTLKIKMMHHFLLETLLIKKYAICWHFELKLADMSFAQEISAPLEFNFSFDSWQSFWKSWKNALSGDRWKLFAYKRSNYEISKFLALTKPSWNKYEKINDFSENALVTYLRSVGMDKRLSMKQIYTSPTFPHYLEISIDSISTDKLLRRIAAVDWNVNLFKRRVSSNKSYLIKATLGRCYTDAVARNHKNLLRSTQLHCFIMTTYTENSSSSKINKQF